MEFKHRAMLVSLTIHQWTAMKHDRSVSAEVEQNHAAKNAGRYNKYLVPRESLATIQAAASLARKFHYSRSLAWGDTGQRLMPAALFMDYRDELQRLRDVFNTEVRRFISDYPALVQSARQGLGSMYKPEDYPSSVDLVRLFGIELDIMPVPDGADFRVDVSNEAQAEIREQIEAAVSQRQFATVKECWSRLREVLTRIVEQCSKEKPVIRESLMDNASDLVMVLAGLNVTNNPDVAEAERGLRELIVSTAVLRANSAARIEVAEKASKILAGIPV